MPKLYLIFLVWIFSCLLALAPHPVSAQTVSPTESTQVPGTSTLTPGPASIPVYTVQIATPGPDGRVIHKVVSGQTLIIIAAAYGVSINDLMALNGLTADSVIYPDQELIIQVGSTPTATPSATATATPTPMPTSTRRPTRTPAPSIQAASTDDPAIQTQPVDAAPSAQSRSDLVGKILLVAVAVLGLGGVILIVLGALLRRSS